MKKMMSRLVLALLVVALVCAMIPAAFAAEGDLYLDTSSKALIVGETFALSAKVEGSDGSKTDASGVTWTSADDTIASVSGGTVTAKKAGTVAITAKVGETGSEKTATCSVTVSSAILSYTNPDAVTKAVGTELSALGLPTSVSASFGAEARSYAVSWACETYNKDTAGNYTFTGTVTLPNGVTAEGVPAPTVSVTLVERPEVSITGQNPADLYVKKDENETTNKTLSVSASSRTEGAVVHYQWYKSSSTTVAGTPVGSDQATITVDVSSKGTWYYYCDVKSTKDGVDSETMRSRIAKVVVRDEYEVELTANSTVGTTSSNALAVGGEVALTAKVTKLEGNEVKVYPNAALTWHSPDARYASVTGGTSTASNGTASGYFKALGTDSASVAKKITVSVSAYNSTATIDLYVKPATADAITYSAAGDGVEFNSADFLNVVDTATNNRSSLTGMDYVKFDSLSSIYGKLYRSSNMYYEVKTSDQYAYDPGTTQYDLDDVYFVPRTTDKVTITYTAYSDSHVVLATGSVVISDSYGDIEYTTSAGQSVTFDEDDFDKFFRSEYTNGDLDYVVFDVSYDDDLDTRTYGYLYETSKGTSLVGKRDKYYFEASASQADLDAVTFTAGTYTKKYALTIPFTAYGADRNGRDKELSGYVTITVNDGSSASIYSIGTSFEKLYDAMIPEGYTTTSSIRNLCVVFDTVTNGRLFYDYDTIADASVVDLDDDVFYFSATGKNDLDLEEVYFVPAAGATSAKITYTVYDGNTKVDNGSLTFSIVQQTKSNYFSDVTAATNGTWSANAIDFMSYNELVTGTSSKAFSPNMTMNRAMLVTILYRIEGQPSVNITNPFTDVKKGSYYYDAVLWAYKNDIVTGTTKTAFNPDGAVTREQIAAILYRYAGTPKTSGTLTGYTDRAKVSSYAETALAWAVKNGIITSKSSTTLTLDPAGKGTRAEVAVMLHRYLTK